MTSTLRSRCIQLALGSFVLATSGACGFLFSKAPPEGHEQLEYFTCTESDAGPIIDIIWGGLNVLGALTVASDPNAYQDPNTTIAIGLAWGGVSTAAAVTGFNRSKKCRAAKALLAQRQAPNRSTPVAGAPLDASAVQTVVLTPQSDTLAVGATLQLVATAYHSSGIPIPAKSFTWSSSNDAVASVSNAGLVSANAPGSVVIAANTGNVVGTARLTIVSAHD